MHQRIESILNGIISTRRVSNAYLFIGPPGSEKKEAALNFAKTLSKIERMKHPDLLVVEKDNNSIKIEQIRQLKELLRYGPSEADYLFTILNDADTMTIEAANSFLKLLEEPPPKTVFILLCSKEEALPKTILSRCQKIIFPEVQAATPDREAADFYNSIKNCSSEFDFLRLADAYPAEDSMLNSLLTIFYNDLYTEENYNQKNLISIKLVSEIGGNLKKRASKKMATNILLLRLSAIWNKN
ncbi:hypothetical protein ACFL52_01755 [Candidatus Margulisiibacteriota bacterium]